MGRIRRIVGGEGVGRDCGRVGIGGDRRDRPDGHLDGASHPPPGPPRYSHTNNVALDEDETIDIPVPAPRDGRRDDAPSSYRRNDDDATSLASSSPPWSPSSNGRGRDDVPTSSSATCVASRVGGGARGRGCGGCGGTTASSSSLMCMGASEAMDSILGRLADVVLDCISHGKMDDACREWTNVPQARECKFF